MDGFDEDDYDDEDSTGSVDGATMRDLQETFEVPNKQNHSVIV